MKLASFECRDLKVGSKCFELCESLESFSCEASKIEFGSKSFNLCSKLERISIKYKPISIVESSSENPNDIIIFNDNFFNFCSLLKYIEVDVAQPITISTKAFYGCKSIISIKLKSLSTITLTKNEQTMKIQQFKVKGKKVKLDNHSFYLSKELQSLRIECQELDIGYYCFSGCSNLKRASLSNSTKIKLGSNAFSDCSQLGYFNINSYYGPTIEELEIGKYCFLKCTILSSLCFWEVQNANIGSYAFANCHQIIKFSLNVSSKLTIGDYCFLESSNLQEVSLTGKDLTAGAYLFDKCYSIYLITIRGTQQQNINSNAYFSVNKKSIK